MGHKGKPRHKKVFNRDSKNTQGQAQPDNYSTSKAKETDQQMKQRHAREQRGE